MVFGESAPGRTVLINGEEFLYFSGTAYLGMPQNELFKHYLWEGLSIYGSNYGSSRNSNFKFKIFEEAENTMASRAGAEAAVTVSSGYLAGQMVVGIFKKKSQFFYAPNTHPAITLHKDHFYIGQFDIWADEIADKISSAKAQEVVIFANSLDPLLCERYNFDWIKELPGDKKISIVIDDSHGIGIIGFKGGGIFTELQKPDHINLIVTGSLGKACGVPGGIIFSNHPTHQKLKMSPVFSGSSPINPAYLYASLKAEKEYEEARQKLFFNLDLLNNIISPVSIFRHIKGFPVFFTENNALYHFLLQRKIFISHFPYPYPESNPISRIVINSLHTENDIKRLGAAILEFNELGNRFIN